MADSQLNRPHSSAAAFPSWIGWSVAPSFESLKTPSSFYGHHADRYRSATHIEGNDGSYSRLKSVELHEYLVLSCM